MTAAIAVAVGVRAAICTMPVPSLMRSVRAAMDFFKLGTADVTAFHDELDLAPFKVKVKTGGGTAGNRRTRRHRHSGLPAGVAMTFAARWQAAVASSGDRPFLTAAYVVLRRGGDRTLPREERPAPIQRERGAGRPTKKDRRRVERLRGAEIRFDMPTVTGTENVLMAAVLAEGDSFEAHVEDTMIAGAGRGLRWAPRVRRGPSRSLRCQ